MNEEKIDQILRGINILLLDSEHIEPKIRAEYNRCVAQLLNSTEKEKTAIEINQEKTKDALCEREVRSKFGTRKE